MLGRGKPCGVSPHLGDPLPASEQLRKKGHSGVRRTSGRGHVGTARGGGCLPAVGQKGQGPTALPFSDVLSLSSGLRCSSSRSFWRRMRTQFFPLLLTRKAPDGVGVPLWASRGCTWAVRGTAPALRASQPAGSCRRFQKSASYCGARAREKHEFPRSTARLSASPLRRVQGAPGEPVGGD